MPQYLLTAKNAAGRTVTELLAANSAKAAIQDLEGRGYQSIVLHTDDAAAQVVRPIQVTAMLTARDLVQNRVRGDFHRTVVMTLRAYAAMWKFLVFTVAIFLLRRAADAAWDWFDAVLAAALLVPAVTALLGRLPVIRYHRMLEAESWRRSDEVLRLLPRVSAKLSPHAAAWHRAKALAGLGRLDEAVQVFSPFANGGELPKARFWTLLATVYRIAEQDDLCIAAYEKALELAPDDPTISIGLANTLLDKRGDVRRAKGLLQSAKQQPLSDLAEPFFAMAEGMIALEEGNVRSAIEQLEAAYLPTRQFAKGNPSSAAAADLLEGRLALAKAMAGDLDAARKHFRRAERRLRALKQDKLRTRCQQVLGPGT
ncbi:MAG TPA: hypothetical protein VG125_05455 [Pirellulales bacterium]|jgi:tetratricopeptide (TPR) repeat protein|nr:hypothetical protein [Pirellulales bacterium]